MGLKIRYAEGQTPLDEQELEGLRVLTISTRAELDEFEQQNIEQAIGWTMNRKFTKEKILSEDLVRRLHSRMFGDVWKWAGVFRKTDKNLGVEWKKIGTSLKQLNDDCLHWIVHKTFPPEEIAIRYKHRLVSIHCFANGNGRHSRLMADIIMNHIFGKLVFKWSRTRLEAGQQRTDYLKAIKAADKGEFKLLLKFAKK